MWVKLKISCPDAIGVTASINMKLEEWKKLRDQLADKRMENPAYEFCRQIEDVVRQAEKEFYPTPRAKK